MVAKKKTAKDMSLEELQQKYKSIRNVRIVILSVYALLVTIVIVLRLIGTFDNGDLYPLIAIFAAGLATTAGVFSSESSLKKEIESR